MRHLALQGTLLAAQPASYVWAWPCQIYPEAACQVPRVDGMSLTGILQIRALLGADHVKLKEATYTVDGALDQKRASDILLWVSTADAGETMAVRQRNAAHR